MADEEKAQSSTGRDHNAGTTRGNRWEHGDKVDTYRAGRLDHMRETVAKIEEIVLNNYDVEALVAALTKWQARMNAAVDGAK